MLASSSEGFHAKELLSKKVTVVLLVYIPDLFVGSINSGTLRRGSQNSTSGSMMTLATPATTYNKQEEEIKKIIYKDAPKTSFGKWNGALCVSSGLCVRTQISKFRWIIFRRVKCHYFSWFQDLFFTNLSWKNSSWKKSSSHQGRKERRSLYCVQTSRLFLFVGMWRVCNRLGQF